MLVWGALSQVLDDADDLLGPAPPHHAPPFLPATAVLSQSDANTGLMGALSAYLEGSPVSAPLGYAVCTGVMWGEMSKKQSKTWSQQKGPPPLSMRTSTDPLVSVYTGALVQQGCSLVEGEKTSPMALQFGQICKTTSRICTKNRKKGDTFNDWEQAVVHVASTPLVVGAVVKIGTNMWVLVAPFKYAQYEVLSEGDGTKYILQDDNRVKENDLWPSEYQEDWFLVHSSRLTEGVLPNGHSQFLDNVFQKYFTRGLKSLFANGLLPYEVLSKVDNQGEGVAPVKVLNMADGFDREFTSLLNLDPSNGMPLTPFFERVIAPVHGRKADNYSLVQDHVIWVATIFATQKLCLAAFVPQKSCPTKRGGPPSAKPPPAQGTSGAVLNKGRDGGGGAKSAKKQVDSGGPKAAAGGQAGGRGCKEGGGNSADVPNVSVLSESEGAGQSTKASTGGLVLDEAGGGVRESRRLGPRGNKEPVAGGQAGGRAVMGKGGNSVKPPIVPVSSVLESAGQIKSAQRLENPENRTLEEISNRVKALERQLLSQREASEAEHRPMGE